MQTKFNVFYPASVRLTHSFNILGASRAFRNAKFNICVDIFIWSVV